MKVVINACYGGFGLSVEAYEWLKARGWTHMDKLGLHEIAGCPTVGCDRFPRHDPLFVQCVEELGDKANGFCAKLCVVETGNVYRITEYDGYESVEDRDGEGITEDEVEQRIAAAVAAERAEIRAEVERRRRDADAASAAPSTHGFVAGFMQREHVDLLAWIDLHGERSKGGAK